jgi:hypothetical protein
MSDERMSLTNHEMDVAPNFICPACGYFCATTWETIPAQGLGFSYECGMVLVTIARQMPLRTVCTHPDGSSSYGGAEIANIKATSTRRMVTPEEAREMLDTATSMADVFPQKILEDAVLLTLAGPIAENYGCYISLDDYPEEFGRAYDRVSNLPDTSPLVQSDNDLGAIQEMIMDILDDLTYQEIKIHL